MAIININFKQYMLLIETPTRTTYSIPSTLYWLSACNFCTVIVNNYELVTRIMWKQKPAHSNHVKTKKNSHRSNKSNVTEPRAKTTPHCYVCTQRGQLFISFVYEYLISWIYFNNGTWNLLWLKLWLNCVEIGSVHVVEFDGEIKDSGFAKWRLYL